MKNLQDYLYDKDKTYQFVIKVAQPLNKDQVGKLKAAMEKFQIVKLSEGRDTPIQSNPKCFPDLQNVAVTTFDAEIKYPTIPPVMREYLVRTLGVPTSYLNVYYANDPIHEEVEGVKDLLNTHEMEQADPNAQELVGQKRISNLLKELNKTKHVGDQYTGVNEQLLASNLPEDTKAVIIQALDVAAKSTLGSNPMTFINPGE